MIFTIFCCLFVKKIQNKVSTPFHGIAYNSNYENHSSNPHQGACSGFQLAACDSKSCLKAGCDLENCSESRLWMYIVHWRQSTNESKGKPEQKFDKAFETLFRICKCFQRSKQKLYIYLSLEQGRLKLYNILGSTENTDLILQACNKKYLSRDPISLTFIEYNMYTLTYIFYRW